MLKIAQKIVQFVFCKRTAIFVFFLILSSFFWLMHTTSKRVKFEYTIHYINKPTNIKIKSNLPSNIRVVIEDSKLSFVDYLFLQKKDTVMVDLYDIDTKGEQRQKTYNIQEIINDRMSNDFGKQIDIINCSPKEINIDYTLLQSKKIGVFLDNHILTKKGYMVSDSISLSPRQITAYATEQNIRLINRLNIKDLPQKDSLDCTTELLYEVSNGEEVSYYPNIIKIQIPIERATTKSLSVPVVCKNAPVGLSMRAFPANISISVAVPFSRYHSIDAEDFTVEIDYQKRHSNKTCIAQIVSKPKTVEVVGILPKEIEFTLEKQ